MFIKKGRDLMDKKKVIKFLIIVMILAWGLQIAGALIGNSIGGMTGTLIFQGSLAICMFAPIVAAFLAKADFKRMGWKPKLKGNFKWILFCMFVPMIMTILGFAVFFAIWPELFSTDLSYLAISYEEAGMDTAALEESLASAGISTTGMILISMLQCITYAPVVNMFLAIGEEAGWRGFLYPELGKRFGRVRTWFIGGAIWAAFHFPAMLLAGYEYGSDYIGAPVLGLVTFTLFCIALGVLHEIIYDKTKCIWFPAILHGSVNAAFTMYQVVLNAEHLEKINKLMVFGPGMNGLVAMIPFVILTVVIAAVVLKKEKKITAA